MIVTLLIEQLLHRSADRRALNQIRHAVRDRIAERAPGLAIAFIDFEQHPHRDALSPRRQGLGVAIEQSLHRGHRVDIARLEAVDDLPDVLRDRAQLLSVLPLSPRRFGRILLRLPFPVRRS
jgi:hypothetical protein